MNLSDSEKFATPKRNEYKFDNINLDDPRVWALISRGRTKGIFQLETPLGQSFAKQFRPSSIKELSALIAILRPVCLESGLADQICKIKNGQEPVSYVHQALEPILKDTYGCLIYQESIIRICQEIAGFTELQSDDARRATGKKSPEEMNKVRKMFMEGCEKTGIVSKEIAETIFSWIEKSVRFSFNFSHSVSYALVSYYTAYQKTFYPTEFFTSALTFSSEKLNPKEEVYELVQDARLHNIQVLPPDLRQKNVDFKITGDRKITFGLAHIRGVGDSSVNNIINNCDNLERFEDFLKVAKNIKRNVAESLIKSGAVDYYGLSRIKMLRNLYAVLGRGKTETLDDSPETKELTLKEYDHFISNIDNCGIMGALQKIINDGKCVKKRIPTIESKITYLQQDPVDSNRSRAIWESLYLGLPLTCSAADDYMREVGSKTCLQVIKADPKTKVQMHIVIDKIEKRKTSEKAKAPNVDYCYLKVSDSSGAINLVLWPQTYEEYKELLSENAVISIKGRRDSFGGKDQVAVDSLELIG